MKTHTPLITVDATGHVAAKFETEPQPEDVVIMSLRLFTAFIDRLNTGRVTEKDGESTERCPVCNETGIYAFIPRIFIHDKVTECPGPKA